MRICIIGIGAMGCLFGARLNEHADVLMIGHWQEQIDAIQDQGLLLIHLDNSHSLHRLEVNQADSDHQFFDLAIVLVKGWQTTEAAVLSRQVLEDDGLAVTLQNGLGNFEILANAVGKERVVQGVTAEGATMIKPGVVRHAGEGTTYLAKNHKTEHRLAIFNDLLVSAGFESRLTENPYQLIWGKLAINAGINPLTALLQVPNGFLATNEIARNIMFHAAAECEMVANAQNIDLPFGNASDQALTVAKATATNRSSMSQDIARGAPTEIDSICGAIVQLGHEFKIATPYNQALLKLVKSQIRTGSW